MAVVDPDLHAALAATVAGRRGVTERKTFGCPAFYAAGKMFAAVVDGGILLKLPPGDAADLLAANKATPFAPRAKPMGGWVVVPAVEVGQVRAAERFVRAATARAARR